jgi:AAA domain
MAKKTARSEAKLADLQAALASVYTPSMPIKDPDLFSGRDDLLADLRAELPVIGAHPVLYGERGVGKTSLWHVLLHDRKVQQHSASAADDFVSIFLRIVEELGEQFTASERTRLAKVSSSVGKDGIASVGSELSEEAKAHAIEQRKLDLNFVLDRLAKRAKSLDAVVIDEFQNVSSKQAVQTQIIEAIKGFADRGVNMKIMLVGVADTADELVSSPAFVGYKGRHFFAHRVPRMEDAEVRDILSLREERFHVHFSDHVDDAIVRIASGYPAVAHRLALTSAQAWAGRAFLGHTRNIVIKAASFLPGLSVLRDVSIRKAGVDVEQQDLQRAVAKFRTAFRDDHSIVAERYGEALASNDAAAINRLLSTLSASPTTWMPGEELTSAADLSGRELEELLSGEARGLLDVAGPNVRLAVRELRTFMQATDYLANAANPPESS